MMTLPQSVPAVMVPRDGLSIAVDVALVVLAVTGVVFLVFGAVQLRRVGMLLQALRGEAGRRAEPILDRSRSIARNVEYISATIRTDVERMNGSIRALSDRLQQAADRMEERIEEFNALMEVVQEEAESAFLGTASTVRGVRAGALSLSGGREDREPEGGETLDGERIESTGVPAEPPLPSAPGEEGSTSERSA